MNTPDTPTDYAAGIEILTSPQGVRYAWHPDHALFADAPTLALTAQPITADDLKAATRARGAHGKPKPAQFWRVEEAP